MGSLTTSVYLPNVLFAVGQGAVVPVIALAALDGGASVALAGAIVALRGAGTMIFDVPAGIMISKLGEERAAAWATALLVAVAVGMWLGPSLILLGLLMFLMGCAWSVWLLARIAFATEMSPVESRGRVMAGVGGMSRLGQFAGAAISSAVVALAGITGAFGIQAVAATTALVVMYLTRSKHGAPLHAVDAVSVMEGFSQVRRTKFGAAGGVALSLQVLRSSRQAILPIWADHIGIGASYVSLLFAISSTVESLLFIPVGMIMDRKGRRWAAMPSVLLLSVGLVSIPLTSGFAGLTVVSMVLGLGNGLGSGINLTLGADLSPSVGRNYFLGVWRLIGDAGATAGPLLVSLVSSMASLAVASAAMGGVGILGIGLLWLAVPETLRGQESATQADA